MLGHDGKHDGIRCSHWRKSVNTKNKVCGRSHNYISTSHNYISISQMSSFNMLQSAKRYCNFDQEHTDFDTPQFRPMIRRNNLKLQLERMVGNKAEVHESYFLVSCNYAKCRALSIGSYW